MEQQFSRLTTEIAMLFEDCSPATFADGEMTFAILAI
jgi:hypothetical protein